MRIFGFQISRTKAVATVPINNWITGTSGWWPIIREPFTGAWQRNMELRAENVLTYSAVYACVTLIASDIAKLRLRLMIQDRDGIWTETRSPAFSPVLDRPNRYQTTLKFAEHWIVSKLLHGNTYVLKERDDRNVVVALYVLDPTNTKPLVSPDGSIFYQLGTDNLTGIERSNITVPASEIIHDTMVALYHPLCGISPLSACGLPALQALAIQSGATRFFSTGSHPGGVLTAPGPISDEVARRIKTHWDDNYTGANSGKVAVLGDGLKFEKMSVNAVDAQLIQQLEWTAEQVCSAFHVPPYMIGVGTMPTYNNIDALVSQYYQQCLQVLIKSFQSSLDYGLQLPRTSATAYGTQFDIKELQEMDTAAKITAIASGIKGGIFTYNEGRAEFDLRPVDGGDQILVQQQDIPIDMAGEAQTAPPPPVPADVPADTPAAGDSADVAQALASHLLARSKQYVIREKYVA